MTCESSSAWQTRFKSFETASQTRSLVSYAQKTNRTRQTDFLSMDLAHDAAFNYQPTLPAQPTLSNKFDKVVDTHLGSKWTEEFVGNSQNRPPVSCLASAQLARHHEAVRHQEAAKQHAGQNDHRGQNDHPINAINKACSRKHCKAQMDGSGWDWNATVTQSLLSHLGIVQAAKDWTWTPSKHYEVDSDASDCSETASLHEETNSLKDATRRLQQLWGHLLRKVPESSPQCECEVDKPVCVDPKDKLRQLRLAGLVHEQYQHDLSTGRHSPLFLPE